MPANVTLKSILADERERDTREKMPEIIRAMGLRQGSTVADIGSGYGYYAVRFSSAVAPGGIVYAEEIDTALAAKLRRRFVTEGLKNLKVLLGTASDPHLPARGVDAVLMADVYHEVRDPAALLAAVAKAMRPRGKLVIVDYLKQGSSGKSRSELVLDHNITPDIVERELIRAGFHVTARNAVYALGYDGIPMWYLVAELPN